MKRKIILLLAAVLTFSMISMNAFAVSVNSVKKDVIAKPEINNTIHGVAEVKSNGAPITLDIRPGDEITSRDSIFLSIENAEFSEALINDVNAGYIWKSENGDATWETICSEEALGSELIMEGLLKRYVKGQGSSHLPYKLIYFNASLIEVRLCPVDEAYLMYNNEIAVNNPRYSIALPIDVQDSSEGAVVVNIDANGSSVTERSYTVAIVIDDDSSTTETGTETTTVRTSSGGSSGGGGGGRSYKPKTTTTTTEATTEATTETATAKTDEKTTEIATEKTSQTAKEDNISKEVRVSIDSNKVVIGDSSYTMDAAPYIQPESNSTLVPLRFAAIAISGESVENADTSSIINWDPNTKTATVKAGKKTVSFTAGSNAMMTDGKPSPMENDVKAEIKDGRMYIPFRTLGNALGVKVDWDADTKTAIFRA